jgi:hypothetical protein
MHFTYLILGDDPDEILAPYNSQPEEDDINCLDNLVYSHYPSGITADTREELITNLDNANIKYLDDDIDWYNSKGVWDWYVVGGRWDKFFLDIDRNNGNSFLKQDIDFQLESRTKKLKKQWLFAMKLFLEEPVNKLRESCSYIEEYDNQSRVILFNKARDEWSGLFGLEGKTFPLAGLECDSLAVANEEEFITNNLYNHYMTYGLLTPEIHLTGDDISEHTFKKEWVRIIKDADPDTLFTLIDCHN